MKATPLDELRKPHPEQARIDAESVAMLLGSAWTEDQDRANDRQFMLEHSPWARSTRANHIP
jgi:hypothetical protein